MSVSATSARVAGASGTEAASGLQTLRETAHGVSACAGAAGLMALRGTARDWGFEGARFDHTCAGFRYRGLAKTPSLLHQSCRNL